MVPVECPENGRPISCGVEAFKVAFCSCRFCPRIADPDFPPGSLCPAEPVKINLLT